MDVVSVYSSVVRTLLNGGWSETTERSEVVERVATMSGGISHCLCGWRRREVDVGARVRVTEGTVPCSRELSSYTTHQALS